MMRQQFTAKDDERCEASIPWAKGETAQCRRRKVSDHYCQQHAAQAYCRVEAGAKVIAAMKRRATK